MRTEGRDVQIQTHRMTTQIAADVVGMRADARRWKDEGLTIMLHYSLAAGRQANAGGCARARSTMGRSQMLPVHTIGISWTTWIASRWRIDI